MIVRSKDFVAVLFFESVTCSVKLYVPDEVGVPQISVQSDPLVHPHRDKPGGNVPAVLSHVVLPVQTPPARTGLRYQLPTVPSGMGLIVVIDTVASFIVIE